MRSATHSGSRAAQRTSDDALLARVQHGDEPAVRALITRYNQQLFRVARGILRNDSEAEDVVQEAYLHAFTRLDDFRHESAFSTWLTHIVLNQASNRLRKNRRRKAQLSQLAEETRTPSGATLVVFPTSPRPATPEAQAVRHEIQKILETAVDNLRTPLRMVFILRDIEGMSTNETAELLSIRPETVKTRLYRARQWMRSTLERSFAPCFQDMHPFEDKQCLDMADRVIITLAQRLNNAKN
ncbi:RNA polymerase sigma factor [Iodidimonas muriae]|uniref:RNA polymerase sigma factor n=1 Tax=Iodidimonas muriae TaxID=261467 RepID=A0ABQ2LG69_9PROT|nr:RNA polymerase sigma factor [Iodidimonas muriae]GER08429.1 RNA polymerase sigma factor [Kordiimonadales bacterium JCM 17843]GGO16957.1 RNA polymerase sigma factor [Iodidimonas muriae]